MAFTTLQEVKRTLRKENTDRDDDISSSIEAATAAVKAYCSRDFTTPAVEETRKYRKPDIDTEPLLIDDVSDTSTISITGNDLTWSEGVEFSATTSPVGVGVARIVFLHASNTWSQIADDDGWITIDAEFGWSEVPAPIELATKLWAARLFKRQDSGEAILGMTGADMSGDSSYIRSVDPDIGRLLAPYAGRRLSVG